MCNDADPTHRGRKVDQVTLEAETRKLDELEAKNEQAFQRLLAHIASEPPHTWDEARKAWVESENAWKKQFDKVCEIQRKEQV